MNWYVAEFSLSSSFILFLFTNITIILWQISSIWNRDSIIVNDISIHFYYSFKVKVVSLWWMVFCEERKKQFFLIFFWVKEWFPVHKVCLFWELWFYFIFFKLKDINNYPNNKYQNSFLPWMYAHKKLKIKDVDFNFNKNI